MGELRVDPEQLKGAGAQLTSAGSSISALAVEAPLAAAGGSVGQLKSADACRSASATLADQKSQMATTVNDYAGGITSAATNYVGRDQASAGEIASVRPS